AFALSHPELRPNLLVRVSGGWIPELEGFNTNHRWTQMDTDSFLAASSSPLSPFPPVKSTPGGGTGVSERLAFAPSAPPLSLLPPVKDPPVHVLLIHGEFDDVFPVSDARRLAAVLQSNGVPVTLKIIPGQSHGFEPDRLLLFRAIGEYCLTRLKGPDALSHYQSILLWQAKAKPLWLFWIPAFLWIGLRCGLWYRDSKSKTGVPKPEGNVTAKREPAAHKSHELTQIGETADGGPPTSASGQPATCNLQPATSGHGRVRLRWWEIGLRWVAGLLAVVAAADTALHLIPPRLPVSERTLAIARKHLVQPKEMPDFDFLSSLSSFPSVQAGPSLWRGKRLKTLLEHVELANYNRELIDWKLDEAHYRNFVLAPQIDPEFDGDLNWRRPLWENFYPRIRKQQTTADAAVIVARFLRERVTIRKAEIGKAENRKYPHPGPLPGGEGEGPANGGRSGGARHEGEDIS